eukprot:4405092-Amphidinium_carterae.1
MCTRDIGVEHAACEKQARKRAFNFHVNSHALWPPLRLTLNARLLQGIQRCVFILEAVPWKAATANEMSLRRAGSTLLHSSTLSSPQTCHRLATRSPQCNFICLEHDVQAEDGRRSSVWGLVLIVGYGRVVDVAGECFFVECHTTMLPRCDSRNLGGAHSNSSPAQHASAG